MKMYHIIIEKPAKKFILKQQKSQQERLLRAIHKLPYEGDIRPVQGHPGEFRLRVGTFRVIYHIQNEIVTVIVTETDNRGDAYKRK